MAGFLWNLALSFCAIAIAHSADPSFGRTYWAWLGLLTLWNLLGFAEGALRRGR